MKRPITVLLVEDNEMTRGSLRLQLESDSLVTVVERSTLQGAVEEAKKGKVDVILFDLFLPDCGETTGISVLRKAVPCVPVVVITGYGNEWEEASLIAGAEDYLQKAGLSCHDLVTVLRHAIIRNAVQLELTCNYCKAGWSMNRTGKTITEAEEHGSKMRLEMSSR